MSTLHSAQICYIDEESVLKHIKISIFTAIRQNRSVSTICVLQQRKHNLSCSPPGTYTPSDKNGLNIKDYLNLRKVYIAEFNTTNKFRF